MAMKNVAVSSSKKQWLDKESSTLKMWEAWMPVWAAMCCSSVIYMTHQYRFDESEV